MRAKNNTNKQERPRRARMPQKVYDVASTINHRLTNFEAAYPNDAFWKGSVTDEALCREVAAPLRELSSMAFCKELDPEINTHPHNNPFQVQQLIIEAMRLAYGIQDLIDAGRRVNKFERHRCLELFTAFKKLKKASDDSDRRRSGQRQEREVVTPQALPQTEEVITLAEVVNLAAYKTEHGIECATTPNIFGATVHNLRRTPFHFQVGDTVIGIRRLRDAGEQPVQITAVEIEEDGDCTLSFDDNPPRYSGQFYELVKRAGEGER